jgi:uncharacterized protein (TIGR00297 family)
MLTSMWVRAVLGIGFSLGIALFALRRGSLSRSGAAAALVIGSVIYLGGGHTWFLALVAFFLTSTLLGKVGKKRKAAIKHEFEKGDTRDALQALSNGGIAAACAFGMLIHPHPAWAAGFVAALATANGDTWATELGVLSSSAPLSLLTWRRVPRGTSGAVSPLGLTATLLGGLLIGAIAALDRNSFGLSSATLVVLGGAGGVLGSLADSLLGATVQSAYRCDSCEREVEGQNHTCGQATRHVRGFRWFNNDMVNLVATITAAGAAACAILTSP